MTALCIPPGDLVKRDGWYWVDANGHERIAEWSRRGYWLENGKTLYPREASNAGYHYLGPVPTHADLVALVEAARGMTGLYEGDDGCRLLPAYIAIRAALAPFDRDKQSPPHHDDAAGWQRAAVVAAQLDRAGSSKDPGCPFESGRDHHHRTAPMPDRALTQFCCRICARFRVKRQRGI